ncbi:hypothetical protein NHH03_26500 [Stieleria sp. TO1_6]|uniref:hypothetical protein n=1 Tax=Stieleria tagensis TaxID=2956795 RepID=UPI00209B0DF3|nr:hypothetical protein [Stieleria tagensis]MCO8125317.1 hypothetical protein [Stieleria tagensis]
MDHRWRTNHDAAPYRYTPPPQHGSPLLGQTPYAPSAYAPAAAPTLDLRVYHAEIADLRQQLLSVQSQHTKQLESARQLARQELGKQQAQSSDQIAALKYQLAEQEQRSIADQELHEQSQAAMRNELESLRQQVHTAASSNTLLKEELANLAAAASAEQQQQAGCYRSLLSRHESLLAEKEHMASEQERVVAEKQVLIDEYEQELLAWEMAHDLAVDLCQWHDTQHGNARRELAQIIAQHEQFRGSAEEAFQLYEREIQTLQATVAMLRTDHETVELINGDLDHRLDELECLTADLQDDLRETLANHQQVLEKHTSEQFEALQEIESVHAQLDAMTDRHQSISQEKNTLIDTVAALEEASDQYDAAMFAKEQELAATQRVSDEAQRQLEQLRREHGVIAGQNDMMRNQVRELTGSNEKCNQEVADAIERCELAESAVAERTSQLKELQTAARAAEADAMLRANEAEHLYAVELERVENELESTVQRLADATAKSSRLQNSINDLTNQLDQAQRQRDENDRHVETLDATIKQLQTAAAEQSQLAVQADASSGQADDDQQEMESLRRRIDQLTDDRERIQAENEQLRVAADGFRTEFAGLEGQNDYLRVAVNQLQSELDEWSQYQNPVAEVKRLSAELANRISRHASEREALCRRIEQLQDSRSVSRAA